MGWIIGGILGVIALIGYAQHRAQRGVYRPLSSRQPARRAAPKPELGLEAIDMRTIDRTTRRNEALERGHTNWTRGRHAATAAADTDIEPLADDETYAKRFHAAFLKDRDKD